jgi:hypothetical protein
MLFFLKSNHRNCDEMPIAPLTTIIVMALGLMMSINIAFADSEETASGEFRSFAKLSAEWQQWALSIPAPENPQLDATGQNCVVGQRGPIWFLAGIFGGGSATRTCSVPEGKALYFPVINSVQINTPGVCGQPGALSVRELRDTATLFIDGATNLSVTVDGIVIKKLRRVRSEVFVVALPENNVFVEPCTVAGLGDVPPGVYSPAVDEGFYVLLNPLPLGPHALHFHAENPSAVPAFTLDVTYNLTVVPVLLK